ncbi:MAG: thioredoxin domain-containing protein [Candidatus Magasanikbacteria bacterium]|nr:thioredoxin domain-containing protein [Candidatus Magasanikbacteria bacterium]
MIKTKLLAIIFIPAILVAGLALFVRIIQYEPLYPEIDKNKQAEVKKESLITIPIYPTDPIIGEKKAPRTVIAFEDFGCEHCQAQFAVIEEFMAKHPGAVKIIWKSLPVTKFPYASDTANEYAYCLNEQNKFMDFARLAFTNSYQLKQDILDAIVKEINANEKKLNACIQSGTARQQIERVKEIARLLNIQAIPAIFLDNKQVNPPATVEGWESMMGL